MQLWVKNNISMFSIHYNSQIYDFMSIATPNESHNWVVHVAFNT